MDVFWQLPRLRATRDCDCCGRRRRSVRMVRLPLMADSTARLLLQAGMMPPMVGGVPVGLRAPFALMCRPCRRGWRRGEVETPDV